MVRTRATTLVTSPLCGRDREAERGGRRAPKRSTQTLTSDSSRMDAALDRPQRASDTNRTLHIPRVGGEHAHVVGEGEPLHVQRRQSEAVERPRRSGLREESAGAAAASASRTFANSASSS